MNDEKTLEELEEILIELREENTMVAVIVEGDKDVAALRNLELSGEIIAFNRGKSVSDFCDGIASKYQKVILLTDWDWRGGRLCQQLKKNLENRVEINIRFRQLFAKRCPCRSVEGMPSWISTLRKKVERV